MNGRQESDDPLSLFPLWEVEMPAAGQGTWGGGLQNLRGKIHRPRAGYLAGISLGGFSIE